MTAFWLLAALCVVLLAALSFALQRLYSLELRAPGREAAAPPETASEDNGASRGPRSSSAPGAAARRESIGLDAVGRAAAALQDYAIAKADTGTRHDFCKLFLEEIAGLASSRRGWVWTWEEDKASLYLSASSEPAATDAPAGDGAAERAFQARSAVWESGDGGRGVAAIPLMARSTALGVLQLEADGSFDESLRAPLALLAGEAAAVLNQLSRFESLQRFHLEMVETLYRTLHAGDPDASRNAERTRRRTRRLALALGLTEQMARHVEYAALLRGVGKIGVDQAILNKPGKLTAEEYEKIKKYTTIGHQILGQVKLLAPSAKMVLHHQEWYNGRGYPEGLKGDDIPLGARIIAVISAWEAMTSNRPYRKALAPAEAMAELRRGAGDQFDPAVVDAFDSLRAEDAPG